MKNDIAEWLAEYRQEPADEEVVYEMEEAADVNDADAMAALTDTYFGSEEIICALYEYPGMGPERTEATYRAFHDIRRGVLLTLKHLAYHEVDKFREATFSVWMGDPYYIAVGVPANLDESLWNYLLARFRMIDGYSMVEQGSPKGSSIFPRFRYESGDISAYEGSPGQVVMEASTGAIINRRAYR